MNKFTTLLEGVFNRYNGGGFLTGDIVTIKDDYASTDWGKEQAANVLDKIKDFIDSGLTIRVSSVKGSIPAASGSIQQDNQPGPYFCDIIKEISPGLWHEFITVPASILVINNPDDAGLPPIPDALKRKDDSHIKPSELGEVEQTTSEYLPYFQTKNADKGQGKLVPIDAVSPDKDVKQPGGQKWDDSKPGGGNIPKNSVFKEQKETSTSKYVQFL